MTDGRNYARDIALALGKADAQSLGEIALELMASLSEARGAIARLEAANSELSEDLARRREGERERKRRQRHAPSQDVTGRHGTDRDSPAFSPTPPFSPPASTALHRAKLPDMENALALRLPSNAGRNALTTILRKCGDPVGVVAEIGMVLDGGRPGTPSNPATVELALCDYAANEARWSSVAFRAYVLRAAQPVKPANGNGHRRGGTGQRSYDNALEALKDR